MTKTDKNANEAMDAVRQIGLLLKFGDVTVASDVETIALFICRAINDDRETDISTLARLAKALPESSK